MEKEQCRIFDSIQQMTNEENEWKKVQIEKAIERQEDSRTSICTLFFVAEPRGFSQIFVSIRCVHVSLYMPLL